MIAIVEAKVAWDASENDQIRLAERFASPMTHLQRMICS
jgi:hypothetical protein